MINTLFHYSKLETNTYDLNIQEQDICALVRGLVAEGYEKFESKEIELQIDIPDKSIMCRLDSIEFKRAFNNIIINDYKHLYH